MKIVTDSQIPGLAEGIASARPEYEVVALKGQDIRPEHVAEADALIVRTRTKCNAELLSGSNVKLIGTATIGTDHIDIPWCESHGIRVVSAPGCNAPAVMQYVAASLQKAGFDPSRDTLGVVGKGHIGSLVTDLYRKAGVKVLVCDPPRKEAGFRDEDYISLNQLLTESDAVTFHVPYTEAGPYLTRHLLSGPLPERPRILVNASRGEVADSELILRESKRRKFIIDTWAFEDHPEEWSPEERRRLIDAAFIATPHIAGYSIEGKRRATLAMLAALGIDTAEDYAVAGIGALTLEDAAESFDPTELSRSLKASPRDFEQLRGAHLRPEPKM